MADSKLLVSPEPPVSPSVRQRKGLLEGRLKEINDEIHDAEQEFQKQYTINLSEFALENAIAKLVADHSATEVFGSYVDSLGIADAESLDQQRFVSATIHLAALVALRMVWKCYQDQAQERRELILANLSTLIIESIQNALGLSPQMWLDEKISTDEESNKKYAAEDEEYNHTVVTIRQHAAYIKLLQSVRHHLDNNFHLLGTGADYNSLSHIGGAKSQQGSEQPNSLFGALTMPDTSQQTMRQRLVVHGGTMPPSSAVAAVPQPLSVGQKIWTGLGVFLMATAVAALVTVNILFPPLLLFTALVASAVYIAGLFAVKYSAGWQRFKQQHQTAAKWLATLGGILGGLFLLACPLLLGLGYGGIISIPGFSAFGVAVSSKVVVGATAGMALVNGFATVFAVRGDWHDISQAQLSGGVAAHEHADDEYTGLLSEGQSERPRQVTRPIKIIRQLETATTASALVVDGDSSDIALSVPGRGDGGLVYPGTSADNAGSLAILSQVVTQAVPPSVVSGSQLPNNTTANVQVTLPPVESEHTSPEAVRLNLSSSAPS